MTVMIPPDEATFSDLVNRPSATVARLVHSRSRSLLLKRRNEEDLVLVTATKARQDGEVAVTTMRLFSALLRHNAAPELLADVIADAFPWVKFLPAEDGPSFITELIDTLRAIEDLDTPAPLVQVITDWRHTAEVHADPDLADTLRRGVEGDFGPVQPPTA